MNMIGVTSSNLVAVGYDASSQTLRIQFKSGLYDYYNVPQHIYNSLMSASSHGEYHASYIKNSYRYKRIS
ncbi:MULTISPECIES: KTSC domain-containing protein [Clostridium]|uniref:KTSC domain-containing protein n=1 Tax=Clostridium TaxID=1485 RepID=UPI001F17E68C|nr:KTSC domain-containing protein [Clostridium beijerinckii]